jgi:hypothetical protein
VGRDIAVGIETRYGMDDPGIESRWWRDFPHPSRQAQGPTQPLMSLSVTVDGFLVGGLGVEDQQNGLCEVPILLLVIYFSCGWMKVVVCRSKEEHMVGKFYEENPPTIALMIVY